MPEEIGAYEAKTHLPALLEPVARGDRITITKHGRPIARLAPIQRSTPERRREARAAQSVRRRPHLARAGQATNQRGQEVTEVVIDASVPLAW
jgi:prevent-host-death family protein